MSELALPTHGDHQWGASWLAVVVPDHGESADRYRPLAEALEVAGAVVIVGLPGRLVPDFEAAVDELAAVVDRHGESPVVLVGHGVGGMIVVRYAQRFPDHATALVLSAPVLGPWPTLDLLSEAEIPAGRFDRAELAAVEECLSTIDFDHPLGDNLPALWVHGGDDAVVPMADTRAGLDRVRGLQFEELIMPSAGNDLLDEPGVRDAVVGFMTRVVQDAGGRSASATGA